MKKEIVIMIFAVIIVAIVFFSKQIKTAVNSFRKPTEIIPDSTVGMKLGRPEYAPAIEYAIEIVPDSQIGMNLGLPEYAPAPLATYADASGQLVSVPTISLPTGYTVVNNPDGSVTVFVPDTGGNTTAPNIQAALFALRSNGMLA